MNLSLLMSEKELLWKQIQLSPWAGKLLAVGKAKTKQTNKPWGCYVGVSLAVLPGHGDSAVPVTWESQTFCHPVKYYYSETN